MKFIKNILNPYSSDDKMQLGDLHRINTDDKLGDTSSGEESTSSNPVIKNDTNGSSRGSSSLSDIGVLRESLKELIMDSLVPFTGNDDFSGFSIWINNQFYHILNNEVFKKELRALFDSMHLYSLGNGFINIVYGEPMPQDEASLIFKEGVIPAGQVWIRLYEKDIVVASSSKAVITIFQGNGSCKEKEYILSSEDKTVYHIGRGAISRNYGSTYRMNDIIVEDDNPDNHVQKLNNSVSRAQADIIFNDGNFFLRAMPSGCRSSGGSATKIIRDQKPIELRDSLTYYKLCDGDIIELGKSVLLLYKNIV